MSTLKEQYKKYMADLSPEIDDLSGDLPALAGVIEKYAPGYGVKVVLRWATNFRGISVHWHNLDRQPEAQEYARSQQLISETDELPIKIHDLPSAVLKMLATDALDVAPKIGLHITLRVAWAFRGCDTHMHNIDAVLSGPRNSWIIKKYDEGGIAVWELAVATGLSQRRVEEILGTIEVSKDVDKRQLKLWE